MQKQPPEVIYKKAVFRNFAKPTGKHLLKSLEKETLAHVFPVNFAKFFRIPFLQNKSAPGDYF